MSRLDLTKLSIPDAQLIQHGLNKLGYYEGTYLGKPGPLTQDAYDRFRAVTDGASAASMPAASASVATGKPGQSIAEVLVAVLSKEEGVREVPQDSNTGPRVLAYQRATWLDGTGWPWCAAFICWGLQQVEKQLGGLGFARPQTAGAWDFENWATKQKLKLMKPRGKVKRGDIVCFTFSHIGLAIEDEKNGSVRTVEGNTNQSGSREGGGVYIQTRAVSLIRSNIRLEKA